ncbi:glycosyltransferase [Methylorubrum extorquens]|uniref:Glycosyl transferase family 2 n=1 Tax=Methylorubrum extorquens DSM 13060 TaxID=882800 RepID=H1KM63_METEX|nr:glycosyltransferase [Methylorubrum extorquens]EHP91382.1 glycosyl transferase family 2 [Methylorubrum extorquens DSM 13060]
MAMKKKIINVKRSITNRFVQNNNLDACKEIFDERWYLQRYIGVEKQIEREGIAPFEYFLNFGIADNHTPNALFDYEYYLRFSANQSSGSTTAIGLLQDFINNPGAKLASTHPLFDPIWYLSQNKDVLQECVAGRSYPLMHFIKFGAAEGRNPHPLFNSEWYLDIYPDARKAVVEGKLNAISHYLLLGSKLGYSPSSDFDTTWYIEKHTEIQPLISKGTIDALSYFIAIGEKEGHLKRSHVTRIGSQITKNELSFNPNTYFFASKKQWALSKRPLVSIIIVNKDGSHHLPALIDSLLDQTYTNFEIIFVDNASEDNSCAIMRLSKLPIKIIELKNNLGFAEANNIGLRSASGELIGILNNDTRADKNWLSDLVSTIKYRPNAAAVTSKIRFWTKFTSIKIRSNEGFSLEKNRLLESLHYKKFFTDIGHVSGDAVSAVNRGDRFEISLKAPVQSSEIVLQISATSAGQYITIENEFDTSTFAISDESESILYKISDQAMEFGEYVINNAGSDMEPDLTTFDRGFGEFDRGQFDTIEVVRLLCGCAALIRRDALQGYDLFVSDFVAYYEDSELSMRLNHSGLEIYYCPSAIIYHKHSSTSVERSEFWMTYVNRNRVIFRYMLMSSKTREDDYDATILTLNHHKSYFENRNNILTADDKNYSRALPKIISDLPILRSKVLHGELHRKSGLRIGIYDNFWHTLGGGEAHALSFIDELSTFGRVELISEFDFDLDRVLRYFGKQSAGVAKRLVHRMVPEVTSEYDLFINSTYMSECPSYAKHSIYLVSFPSRTPSAAFLSSYYFLANSRYTASWMSKLWGSDKYAATVFYPAIANKLVSASDELINKKQKIILSVGRFFRTGHSKNQHLIADIFKELHRDPLFADWKLVLVGSVNDESYVREIRDSLIGCNADVLTNVPIETLTSHYAEASIYIHASGYGRDADDEPENFEHFGMTIAEAALNGCFPIVYDAAGPREIVEVLGSGRLYSDLGEARIALYESVASVSTPGLGSDIMGEVRRKALRSFMLSTSSGYREAIRGVLSDVGLDCKQSRASANVDTPFATGA